MWLWVTVLLLLGGAFYIFITTVETKSTADRPPSGDRGRPSTIVKTLHRPDTNKQYRVLSIDGGGIRIAMPVVVIRNISVDMIHASFLPDNWMHRFHAFAGTSAGAFVAAFMASRDHVMHRLSEKRPDILQAIIRTNYTRDCWVPPWARTCLRDLTDGKDTVAKRACVHTLLDSAKKSPVVQFMIERLGRIICDETRAKILKSLWSGRTGTAVNQAFFFTAPAGVDVDTLHEFVCACLPFLSTSVGPQGSFSWTDIWPRVRSVIDVVQSAVIVVRQFQLDKLKRMRKHRGMAFMTYLDDESATKSNTLGMQEETVLSPDLLTRQGRDSVSIECYYLDGQGSLDDFCAQQASPVTRILMGRRRLANSIPKQTTKEQLSELDLITSEPKKARRTLECILLLDELLRINVQTIDSLIIAGRELMNTVPRTFGTVRLVAKDLREADMETNKLLLTHREIESLERMKTTLSEQGELTEWTRSRVVSKTMLQQFVYMTYDVAKRKTLMHRISREADRQKNQTVHPEQLILEQGIHDLLRLATGSFDELLDFHDLTRTLSILPRCDCRDIVRAVQRHKKGIPFLTPSQADMIMTLTRRFHQDIADYVYDHPFVRRILRPNDETQSGPWTGYDSVLGYILENDGTLLDQEKEVLSLLLAHKQVPKDAVLDTYDFPSSVVSKVLRIEGLPDWLKQLDQDHDDDDQDDDDDPSPFKKILKSCHHSIHLHHTEIKDLKAIEFYRSLAVDTHLLDVDLDILRTIETSCEPARSIHKLIFDSFFSHRDHMSRDDRTALDRMHSLNHSSHDLVVAMCLEKLSDVIASTEVFQTDLVWKLKTVFGLLGPKYKSEKLHAFMDEWLGDFGMHDDPVTEDLIITTMDAIHARPIVATNLSRYAVNETSSTSLGVGVIDSTFNSLPYGNNKEGLPYPSVAEIVKMSTAAPTYFPSFRGIVDGALLSNNPALLATFLAEAVIGVLPENIMLVSLGTGEHKVDMTSSAETLGEGIIRWGAGVADVMLSGNLRMTEAQQNTGFSNNHIRITRQMPPISLDEPAEVPKIKKWSEPLEARPIELAYTLGFIRGTHNREHTIAVAHLRIKNKHDVCALLSDLEIFLSRYGTMYFGPEVVMKK
jgi:predicted acylesterase/phospholipase RssA